MDRYNLRTCLSQVANCNNPQAAIHNLQPKTDEAYAMSKLIRNQHKIQFLRKENIKILLFEHDICIPEDG